MLAGRAHGIGTCLTTVLGMFKPEKAFEILNIPNDKGWKIDAVITAGYPLGNGEWLIETLSMKLHI